MANRMNSEAILKMLPEVLRDAREAAGLTVQEAAVATGFSPQTIENSERRGRPYTSLDYFLGILEAYSVSFEDLEELLRLRRERQLREQLGKLETRVAALEHAKDRPG